jgi:hypothetical protein
MQCHNPICYEKCFIKYLIKGQKIPIFALPFRDFGIGLLKINTTIMGMNKNTILGWATLIMIVMGLLLIALGAFRYDDVAGWGFGAVGVGFLANAWVFSSLKGRL